jgi:hypothetical protein
MVNRGLVWVLQPHRSALDHLVNLEYHIQDTFLLRQHLVAVLFDLQKAYVTTWRYGILRTHTAAISGAVCRCSFLTWHLLSKQSNKEPNL